MDKLREFLDSKDVHPDDVTNMLAYSIEDKKRRQQQIEFKKQYRTKRLSMKQIEIISGEFFQDPNLR